MSAAEFEVAYDGPSLANHTMEISDLAPALLAISALLREANAALNGKGTDVSVRIKTGVAKGGSVHAELLLVLQPIADLLGSGPAHNAHDLLALIGFLKPTDAGFPGMIRSLLDFLHALGGRSLEKAETLENGSKKITLTGDGNVVGDNITLIVSGDVESLRSMPRIQKLVAEMLEPTDRPGIDRFDVYDNGEKITSLDRRHTKLLGIPLEEKQTPEVEENISELWVTVRKHWNQPGNQWSFDDGSGMTIDATIEDSEFWAQMNRDAIAPTPNAKFRIRVRRRQEIGDSRGPIRTELVVEKVLEYIPAAPQPDLFTDRYES